VSRKKSYALYNCIICESFTIKDGKKYTSSMKSLRELAIRPMVWGTHPTEGSREQVF